MKATVGNRQEMARAHGFTLFEAFVVLVIVAILAIVSVPAIINTLTFQQLVSASETFVNQVEYARVQAAARNRAYELQVVLSDGQNSGAIVLNEGISSACTTAVRVAGMDQQNFQDDGIAPEPIPGVHYVNYPAEHEMVHIETIDPPDLVSTSLCLKPDGRVLRLDTGGPVAPTSPDYAAGEAVFTLRLYQDKGKPTDHVRRVVVPYNGIPKLE